MFYWLSAFVILSILLKYVAHASATWIFIVSVLAVAVLGELIRRSTEELANRVGPAIGGLFMVSFGSIAELMLALFVLMDGKTSVVQAQITGSIIGTSLLGLGLAILVGGFKREHQVFSAARVGLLSTLLILVVIALLLPAVFDYASQATRVRGLLLNEEQFSLGASVVLLMLYIGNLIYTLLTHRNVFAADGAGENRSGWSAWSSIIILLSSTVLVAWQADVVSGVLEETAASLDISADFLGVIVLGIVGTAADLIAATAFAHRDKIGLAIIICIGSAIQMAIVVAPLLVIISWAIGTPMSLVFSNPLYLFAIAATAFVVNAVARDGKTTWFEGLLLVGVYALFGLSFFFSTPV